MATNNKSSKLRMPIVESSWHVVSQAVNRMEHSIRNQWPELTEGQRKCLVDDLVIITTEVEQLKDGRLDAMPEDRQKFWAKALTKKGA